MLVGGAFIVRKKNENLSWKINARNIRFGQLHDSLT